MSRHPERNWTANESVASSGSSSTNKRRRIGLACTACRARKSRCDGARPKCSACGEFGFDCVYAQSSSSPNMIVGKEYLGNLEDRLKAVEEEIISLKSNKPLRQLRFEENESSARDEMISRPSNHEGLEVNSNDLHDNMVAEDVTDGMGAAIFSEEEDFGFFGPSSNIAFTRHISHAVTRVSGSRQVWTEQAMVLSKLKGGVMSMSRPVSPTERGLSHQCRPDSSKINIYALPTEEKTRELVKHYFSTTGLLFPYLHEPTFWATYEEMRQSRFKKVRRTWMGLLNMVFALATSTSVRSDTNARKRVEESDLFYQRAAGLCEKQMLRASSLEAVQFLLVMGQYLQGTQKSVQAWTIHGLTVKAAFQLGLHSSVASERFSPFEQEIRKRTWYGCVVLDRTLSMTFGRPASIPDDYIRLELPKVLDDDRCSMNQEHSVGVNSVLFFNATIRLYKIMWNVIALLYGGNVGCDGPDHFLGSVSHLFKMEQQLVDWERELPPSLFLRKPQDIPTDNGDLNEKFRIILTLRHHNLRILVHRSILVRFLDIIGTGDMSSQELALLQQIGSNSVDVCVLSSIETIAIVSVIVKSGDSRNGMLGAWWFTLYYVFNAALVLCASLLVYQSPSVRISPPSVSLESLRASIDEASQALQLLDNDNLTITICVKYLRQLASVLDHIISAPNAYASEEVTAAQTLGNLNGQSDLLGATQAEGMTATNLILSGVSPLGIGMDVGEFILDGDLEFLNQMIIPMSNNMAFAD